MKDTVRIRSFVIALCCITVLITTPMLSAMIATNDQSQSMTRMTFHFSPPIITECDGLVSVNVSEASSWMMTPGNPKIPVVTKTIMFPPGTSIKNVQCFPGFSRSIDLEARIRAVPAFRSINGDKTLGSLTVNEAVYQSPNQYPDQWIDYSIGAGLDHQGNHKVILSLRLYPLQYTPIENSISCVSEMTVSITTEQESLKPFSEKVTQETDLVIIGPDRFIDEIDFFVENKTRHGLSVETKSIEDIYEQYEGRDHQEQIKYCIHDMVREKRVSYVLLLGDMKTVPVRNTDAYPWDDPKPFHGKGLLTDLYYADVFDSSFDFCSWDANKNEVYGEVDFDHHHFPPAAGNIDEVDLYADVHIGRIPASSVDELIPVLEKICVYEEVTAYQLWFNKIILAGGDTFPLSKGSPFNQFEGEITNKKVAQQLPGFDKVYLWASERNLNAFTFNRAFSEGAGFVSYAGHGFEHGWGTYRPNAVIDKNLIIYYSPFLQWISNGHKTPIVFLDACLTAKLDFNISDLISYYGNKARFVNRFLGLGSMDFLPPFAWALLKQENGGAIATIGATRPAYTWVDSTGVYAGAGYLDVRFFHAYEEGITIGEMFTQAQHDYLNYVMKDYFTIEEFMLLGDPSMRVGGYP